MMLLVAALDLVQSLIDGESRQRERITDVLDSPWVKPHQFREPSNKQLLHHELFADDLSEDENGCLVTKATCTIDSLHHLQECTVDGARHKPYWNVPTSKQGNPIRKRGDKKPSELLMSVTPVPRSNAVTLDIHFYSDLRKQRRLSTDVAQPLRKDVTKATPQSRSQRRNGAERDWDYAQLGSLRRLKQDSKGTRAPEAKHGLMKNPIHWSYKPDKTPKVKPADPLRA
jgi:hypothetical protein